MSVRKAFRNKRLVAAAAVPVAVVASGALVWQSTYAAFSAQTENPTSNWKTGSVALSDNDSGTALFNATNLKPGSSGFRCINVTSTGSLASTVKLYGTGFSQDKNLGDVITLKVEEGSGATGADCTNFTPNASGATIFDNTLSSFAATKTNFASGVGTWAPAGGDSANETKSYRVTYTVSGSAGNAYQSGSAAIGLTWEAQNS